MTTATQPNPSEPRHDPAVKPIQEANVLVVDDSRTMRLVLIRALNGLGFTNITEANDGRQAMDLITQKSFDLMLLDMEMPEMNGMEVLQAVQANPKLKGLPIIVISGAEQIENAVQCIEAGAEDYLPKPFNPTLLRARVTSSLEKKRLRDLDRLRFIQLQEEKELLEATQKRLTQELEEAARYVRSILPEPVQGASAIDWHYEPSTELAGDSFGYHWIDESHFAIYLLDVCGHGVGAALLSVSAINAIRAGGLSGVDFRDPGAVLAALNTTFPMDRNNNMYFTIWYGVYHTPTRSLRHASGGHPPAFLLLPDGEIEELNQPGLVIGYMTGVPYSSATRIVPPNAKLLVLCDGTYEVKKPDGTMLEFSEFKAFMKTHGAAPDVFKKLLDWLHTMNGPGPLDDDFSLIRILFP